MARYARPVALLVAALVLAVSTQSPSAQLYFPGVKPDDWAFYGDVHVDPLPIDPPEPFKTLTVTKSIRTDIRAVNPPIVIAKQYWELTNQSDVREVTLVTNVETGDGNLTGWVIAGHLNADDTVPLGSFYGIELARINKTVVRPYWDTSRTVNILEVTRPIPGYPATFHLMVYWDQETGVMLETFLTIYLYHGVFQVNARVRATDTSLFPNPEMPRFDLYLAASRTVVGIGEFSRINITLRTGPFPVSIGITASVQPAASFNFQSETENLEGYQTLSIMSNFTATQPGNYTLAVTAMGGPTSRTARTTITVKEATSPPQAPAQTILGLPPIQFYAVSTAIAAVTLLTAYLAFRRWHVHPSSQ